MVNIMFELIIIFMIFIAVTIAMIMIGAFFPKFILFSKWSSILQIALIIIIYIAYHLYA